MARQRTTPTVPIATGYRRVSIPPPLFPSTVLPTDAENNGAMPRYVIDWSEAARAEIRRVRSFYRRSIVAAIDELVLDAERETRNRKRLRVTFGLPEPMWEIRIGMFRVIYEVEGQTARILGVKLKGTRKTGEIL
jgi:mRNA-degrading endonuclease RelE of RelBE toxin-antitoxin system